MRLDSRGTRKVRTFLAFMNDLPRWLRRRRIAASPAVLKEAAYWRRVYTNTLMAQAHARPMTRREQTQSFQVWWKQIAHDEKVAALQKALRPTLRVNAERTAQEIVGDDRRQTWGKVLRVLEHYGEMDAFLNALTKKPRPERHSVGACGLRWKSGPRVDQRGNRCHEEAFAGR